MSLSAIAYISTAAYALTDADINALLKDARDFNAWASVTGALLYDQTGFFQYFEGPPESVAEVYERIKGSRKHYDILELLNRPVERRLFDDWHMGFSHAPANTVQQFAQAEWLKALSRTEERAGDSTGWRLLKSYWESTQYGP